MGKLVPYDGLQVVLHGIIARRDSCWGLSAFAAVEFLNGAPPVAFMAEINCLGPVYFVPVSVDGAKAEMNMIIVYGDHRPGEIAMPEATLLTPEEMAETATRSRLDDIPGKETSRS